MILRDSVLMYPYLHADITRNPPRNRVSSVQHIHLRSDHINQVLSSLESSLFQQLFGHQMLTQVDSWFEILSFRKFNECPVERNNYKQNPHTFINKQPLYRFQKMLKFLASNIKTGTKGVIFFLCHFLISYRDLRHKLITPI